MILEDPVEEAGRLLEAAEGEGVTLRAVGGVAVWLRCPSLREADPPRRFHDIDLAAPIRERRPVEAFLEGQGYEPHRRFNTLAGNRLMFRDPGRDRRVDVFLDVMEMCHTLSFADTLAADRRTLPLADLVLSKLQVVRLTDRDVLDLAALFGDHALSNGATAGPEEIDVRRIVEVCSRDWGWWRTVVENLATLPALWAEGSIRGGPDRDRATTRVAELRDLLHRSPKSARWRARALVGERVLWYQDPEEVQG